MSPHVHKTMSDLYPYRLAQENENLIQELKSKDKLIHLLQTLSIPVGHTLLGVSGALSILFV